jgi:hypothetical protein
MGIVRETECCCAWVKFFRGLQVVESRTDFSNMQVVDTWVVERLLIVELPFIINRGCSSSHNTTCVVGTWRQISLMGASGFQLAVASLD